MTTIRDKGAKGGMWAIDGLLAHGVAAALRSPSRDGAMGMSLLARNGERDEDDEDDDSPAPTEAEQRRWRQFGLAVAADAAGAMEQDALVEGPMDPFDWRCSALAAIVGSPAALAWLLERGFPAATPSGMSIVEWTTSDGLDAVGVWRYDERHAQCARILGDDPSWGALSTDALVGALEALSSTIEAMIMTASSARFARDPQRARERPMAIFAGMLGASDAFERAWDRLGDADRARAPEACKRLCELAIEPWYRDLAAASPEAPGAEGFRAWLARADQKDWVAIEAAAQRQGWSLSQGAMEWTSRALGLQGLPWPHGEQALNQGWGSLSAMLGAPAWASPGALTKNGVHGRGEVWRLTGIGGAGVALAGLVAMAGDSMDPREAATALRQWGAACIREGARRSASWGLFSRAEEGWREAVGTLGEELAALGAICKADPGVQSLLLGLSEEWAQSKERFKGEREALTSWGEKLALAAESIDALRSGGPAPSLARKVRL